MSFLKTVFTSRIKLMGGVGMVGVLGTSVPASLAFIDTDTKGSLESAIKGAAKQAYGVLADKLKGLSGRFEKEYTEGYGKAEEEIKASKNKLSDEYQNGTEQAKGYYRLVRKFADDANYYLFEFEPFVKQFLSYLPSIVEDSVYEAIKGNEENEDFLSFQKLTAIALNDGMTDAFSELSKVTAKHHAKLSEINSNDSEGLMAMLKELKNDESDITKWLKKLETNAKEVSAATGEDYCTSTKLLAHLFIGKSSLEGVVENVKKVKSMIETLKKLKTALSLEIDTDSFEQTISELETKTGETTWIDPCPSSTKT